MGRHPERGIFCLPRCMLKEQNLNARQNVTLIAGTTFLRDENGDHFNQLERQSEKSSDHFDVKCQEAKIHDKSKVKLCGKVRVAEFLKLISRKYNESTRNNIDLVVRSSEKPKIVIGNKQKCRQVKVEGNGVLPTRSSQKVRKKYINFSETTCTDLKHPTN